MGFLLLCQLMLSSFAYAEDKKKPWYNQLTVDSNAIQYEYTYYGNKYDDGSYFPKSREQELLIYLENKYLRNHPYQQIEGKHYPLAIVSSMAFAKLFLRYGADLMGKERGKSILANVAFQDYINIKNVPDLSHDEIIKFVELISEHVITIPWRGNLPSNNAIALVKLYLSLGAKGIDGKNGDAISSSLRSYSWSNHSPVASIYENIVKPDEKDFSHKVVKEIDEGDIDTTVYYKTPVTYWLEEFIESGYSAEMLDTHKLHYPRFMKGASVEDVKDMLDKPEAYAIEVNINCNYDKDEDETALICPLIPSINMRDAMGRTPLHIAGNEGNQAVYDYLKNMGADTSIMDYRGNLATLK